MAERTKGSVTSVFPGGKPTFPAQSEVLDPATEDDTLAEGQDANKWSAEQEAVIDALGTGGRAEVTVSGSIATVEALSYVYQGTQKDYAGIASLALQTGQDNYIYLDPKTNIVLISTSAFPATTPHVQLARWDDTGGSPVLTDERPHTLQIASEFSIFAITAGSYLVSGLATIPQSSTSVSVNFGVVFTSAPILSFAERRASDSGIRKANYSNKTTTSFTCHIDSAAPAGGVVIDWQAFGIFNSLGSS